MPINLNRKFSQVPQKESVPYSDKNGSLVSWLDNDNVTRQGNTFNGIQQLVKTDDNGKLPDSVIPNLAITETYVVDTEEEMLSLKNVRVGDICIITQESITYVLRAEPSSTLSNWSEIKVRETPIFSGATSTSNGQKGLVPQPIAGDNEKYLKGDGTWHEIGSVLHTDLENLEESGKEVIKNLSLEACADKDLNNLSQNGNYKLVPPGGNVNYILTKKSSNTGDFEWKKANLEGCLYDSYLWNLTENTDQLNLPKTISDKKYITVILDNSVLTSDNYELLEEGTILSFNGTINASNENPSVLEIKYFTSVSVLEQLAQASETYEGKISLATQEEVNTGTNNNKAITPLTFNTFINENNSLINEKINEKINLSEKATANGVASLNSDSKIPIEQIDINSILKSISGFESSKTQILKNVNGEFMWVEEVN